MKSIIAISGPAGAGKSTLRKLLVSHYAYSHQPFAYFLKNMLRTLLRDQGVQHGDIDRMLNGDLKEVPTPFLGGKTPRHAMQTLGTDWGRELISPSIWTYAWQMRVASQSIISRFVVDDLRFLSEVQSMREILNANLLVIRVEREGHYPSDHLSEREYVLIGSDLTIMNAGEPIGLLHELERWTANGRFPL